MKKHKTTLSLLTIAVVVLIAIFIPKTTPSSQKYEPPSYSVRRVPAPTETSTVKNDLLTVNSQPPSNKLIISKADFKEGGYLLIYKGEEEVGISESFTGIKENIEISLVKETSEGDTLRVLLLDEEGMERAVQEVNIITTAISPGVILPKDLQ